MQNYNYKQSLMDDHFDITSQYIQHKYKLPKIAADKIQQANRFLNDPSSVLKNILQKHHRANEQQKSHHISKTTRVVNPKRQNTLQQQDLRPQVSLITQKMKKFKPANGSFSQFYAEQLSIDQNRGKRNKQTLNVGLDIPRLNLKSNSKDNIDHITKMKVKKMQSSRSTQKVNFEKAYKEQLPYLKKLRLIRDSSELLRQNSRHLLQKADLVVNSNQQNYQKLREQSNRILTGQQKYVLDQQFSVTYRNKVLGGGHIRWKSKK